MNHLLEENIDAGIAEKNEHTLMTKEKRIDNKSLVYLIELVEKIRPSGYKKTKQAEKNFRAVLYQLQNDSTTLFKLRKAFLSQFIGSNIIPALTESGIVSSRGFIQELYGKFKHKLLPPLQYPDDFLYVISRVFYKKKDWVWVKEIDVELWRSFFTLIGLEIELSKPATITQLTHILQFLSYRIVNLALDKAISKHHSEYRTVIQPFLDQNRLTNLYAETRNKLTNEEKQLLFAHIARQLKKSLEILDWIKGQRHLQGASLSQTFITVCLEQNIDRMLIIVDALDANNQFDMDKFMGYFYDVLRYESHKNSVREFLSQNLGMVAYQIAEHKGERGKHYIAETRKEFKSLFISAMGGGFAASFVAAIKVLLSAIPMAVFWQGFVYSLNYATGFVIMDKTGATLATKQPAYTASALAGSLDKEKTGGRPDLKNLAIAVANTSRSQIASFAGNLLIAFPVTYLIAYLFGLATGRPLSTPEHCWELLESQHPTHSFALLYACFTGVFLYISGIIAGYVENQMIYARISDRIRYHPVFSHTVSSHRLNGIIKFMEKYGGKLAGSISLGFFLGFAAPLGKILGIPFDIRHITISTGQLGIALCDLNNNVPITYLLIVILGILLIGFLNFFVSFSLAFFTAVKSRGIHLREYPELIAILRRYFFKHPKDFFWPPKKIRTVDEL